MTQVTENAERGEVDEVKLRSELDALMPSDFPEYLKESTLKIGVLMFMEGHRQGQARASVPSGLRELAYKVEHDLAVPLYLRVMATEALSASSGGGE